MDGYLVKNIASTRQTINFADITSHIYSQAPIVLATPNTQNGNDSYPIPRIRNVTTTGFEISICLDDGNSTCGNPSPEDIGIFVVDRDKASCAENFDTGIKAVSLLTEQIQLPLSTKRLPIPPMFSPHHKRATKETISPELLG